MHETKILKAVKWRIKDQIFNLYPQQEIK
jgi:hypothetical protein